MSQTSSEHFHFFSCNRLVDPSHCVDQGNTVKSQPDGGGGGGHHGGQGEEERGGSWETERTHSKATKVPEAR